MSLPIRTTMEDVNEVCSYLAKKPAGATIKEAKAVLDPKRLDGRKISAFRTWGLLEDQSEKMRITETGRKVTKNKAEKEEALSSAIASIEPYSAIIERAAHRKEESLTILEVGAHWYDHFKDDVSSTEQALKDQAMCFFHLAQGAGLGNTVVGRKGAQSRFDFDTKAINDFTNNATSFVESDNFDESSEYIEGILEQDSDEVENKEGEPDNGHQAPSGNSDTTLGQGIFVAHGQNKKPLEQLKKILDQFKVPYKIATEEPHLGRPISKKVQETMKSCNCAILVFTADEKFKDSEDNEIWRPSENVIHELGAAGYLYDDRIVIIKESSVSFPSNFSDIGYISFDKDQLEAQAMEILRELIGFGIVKIST